MFKGLREWMLGLASLQRFYRHERAVSTPAIVTQPVICKCGCSYRSDKANCPVCGESTLTVMLTVEGNLPPCGSMVAARKPDAANRTAANS